MTIDTSGRWWVGSHPDDVRDYLVAYEAEGYPIDATRLCQCTCGSNLFELDADREEGAARRTCAKCGKSHLICDSADAWEDVKPEKWSCGECGCDTCNVGVGFAMYPVNRKLFFSWLKRANARDVSWISVGVRCAGCGVLGCFVDWKVGYGPSGHLIDAV